MRTLLALSAAILLVTLALAAPAPNAKFTAVDLPEAKKSLRRSAANP